LVIIASQNSTFTARQGEEENAALPWRPLTLYTHAPAQCLRKALDNTPSQSMPLVPAWLKTSEWPEQAGLLI